jgi:hypothetical protein
VSANVVKVTIIDLSLAGAHIVIDGSPVIQVGRKCSLHIVTPEGRRQIELEASAVSRDAEGHVGLAWCNVTPSVEEALRKIVEMSPGTESMQK